jgi:hypothetical protein
MLRSCRVLQTPCTFTAASLWGRLLGASTATGCLPLERQPLRLLAAWMAARLCAALIARQQGCKQLQRKPLGYSPRVSKGLLIFWPV